MLRELRIQSVAVIEDIEVSFGPGKNVQAWEVGTGKLITLDVLDDRVSGEVVRTGRPGAEAKYLLCSKRSARLQPWPC